MKRKLLLVVAIMALLLILSACSRETHPLVGFWESEHTALSFDSDGTGFERIGGQEFAFTWSADGGILVFIFNDDAEGSLINHFMSQIIHGSPVESFSYDISADEDELTISDDHGHGHFGLVLSRYYQQN